MPYDYSDATPPTFELMPANTIATLLITTRPGGVGEDNMLKRSKDGRCEMLDLEYVVYDGDYKGRKFWQYLVLAGTEPGHEQAGKISRGVLRTIVESAKGIRPDDMSPEARAARTIGLGELNGLLFIGKIGVEKGGQKPDGTNWPDKNTLIAAVTPDKKEWRRIEQAPPFDGGGTSTPSTPAAPITRPEWAQ